MAAEPGRAPVNRLPAETTIGLAYGTTHDFALASEGDEFRYAIQVGDLDPDSANLVVQLSVTEGNFSFGSTYAVLPEGNEASQQVKALTLSGPVDDINTALLDLTYHAVGEEETGGFDRLRIETSDGIRSDRDVVTIRITSDGGFAYAAPINQVPEVTISLDADEVHVFGGQSRKPFRSTIPRTAGRATSPSPSRSNTGGWCSPSIRMRPRRRRADLRTP